MSLRRPIAATTALLAGIVMSTVLSGCITGERPTLAEEASGPNPTGDAATDAVLRLLEPVPGTELTAGYQITNNLGPLTRDAVVVQTADGRRSITVGDIRFLLEGTETATCDLGTGTCSSTVDDGRISDLQVTHQFYGRSAQQRLRTDAERRVGPTEGYEAEMAGTTVTCVSVPVAGGTKVYCAHPAGILASYQGPDVLISMTSYSGTADESAFARSR